MKEMESVEVMNYSGHQEISMSARQLTNRRLFLEGEICQDTADALLKKMMILCDQDSQKPITIYINSPGGDVVSGMVIYDLIQGLPCPITCIVTGLAASMAAIILAGGQKGRRLILPHSHMLIHEPRIVTGSVKGTASTVRETAESVLKMEKMLTDLLVRHTGRTAEEVEAVMAKETMMDAEESVSFGLCDDIITPERIFKTCVTDT
ncbi:ClpP family protease [Bilifractor sp. LCP19S3_H10]|uniref:ClpP family protease n=1 Tax=Bilifractor sp. LCP19S3_H10 TaxID=3438736 RepID=UPI003F93A9AD